MKKKLELFQSVVLDEDLPAYGLSKGTRGVIMDILPPDGVAVEFFDAQDRTLDVVLIEQSKVQLYDTSRKTKKLAG